MSSRASLPILIGCIAAICLTWMLWNGAPNAASPLSPAPAGAEAADTAGALRASATADAPYRSVPPGAETTATPSEPLFEFHLDLRLIDDLGIPVEGCRLRVAPDGCVLNLLATPTDAAGQVAVMFRGRSPSCVLEVEDGDGHTQAVSLQSGVPCALTLGCTYQGDEVASTEMVSEVGGVRRTEVLEVRRRQHMHRDTSGSPTMEAGLHPWARFTDNLVGSTIARQGEPAGERAEAETPRFGSDSSLAREALMRARREAGSTRRGELDGQVLAEDGSPATGVGVFVFATGPQPVGQTVTNAAGRFHVPRLPFGRCELFVGGGAEGSSRTAVEIGAAGASASVLLRREACLFGRIGTVTSPGATGMRIVSTNRDGSVWDASSIGPDGHFLLANQPRTMCRLQVWPERPGALPVAYSNEALADSGALVLPGTAGGGLRLRVGPAHSTGIPLSSVRVRVWQLDTGAVGDARPAAGADAWELSQLPAGWYRVVACAPGIGVVQFGRLWIDGRTTTDLGIIPWPQPGRVRFERERPPSPTEQVELYAAREDVDVRVQLDQVVGASELQIPAGTYSLLRRMDYGPVVHRPIVVRAGERSVVALDE